MVNVSTFSTSILEMKIHHLTTVELFKTLQSADAGLTSPEAARRRAEFGPNKVEKVAPESLLLRFLKSVSHFFAVILWIAAGLAFIAETSDPGKGMATLGYAIIGVIFINGMFSFWQEYRAEQAIASLQKLMPDTVEVSRDGRARRMSAVDVVPGDVIYLHEGDSVPADCRLLEAFGVKVNAATITGESFPQPRDSSPCPDEDLLSARNILLAGTTMAAGEATALVFATGMQTEFGKIARLAQTTKEGPSPLQREIIHLSRWVAILATVLGGVFFVIGHTLGLSFWANFMFAIGIIVANVPEGLLPTVSLALAMATRRMAARAALVRHLPAVEALGATTVICTDKTGTLTQNRMTVREIFLGQRYGSADISRELANSHNRFFEAALLCHNLKAPGDSENSKLLGDPLEVALVTMATAVMPNVSAPNRVDEIPFDAERKRLSTLHRMPHGLTLYTKGALEVVLPLCSHVQDGTQVIPLTQALADSFLKAESDMAATGLRVLAMAYRALPDGYRQEELERQLILTGLVGVIDPPRLEVPDAIIKCRAAGIKVIMVTGDHPQTALAIARNIGLVLSPHPVVITGQDLRRLSPTQLQLALDAPEILFARVGADQKMRIVETLKRKNEIVAVTGDGVNDSPALKAADIGIAMGITGTDVAKESADMILLDDNFASIVSAIEEGRAVFDNIRKFLTYILTSNIPEIVPYLAFVLFRIPLPLTVIQILAVDLGTDMLPALGLGTEKPEPGVMQRPPRPRTERLLTWPVVLRAYLFLGVMEAAAAMGAFFFVLHQGGWRYDESLSANAPLYLAATTACLSAIIVMQVINVFLCRSATRSVFVTSPFSNRLIIWGIIVEVALILAIDYTPWGNLVFDTMPLDANVWLYVIPFGVVMLLLEEARKLLVRRLGDFR